MDANDVCNAANQNSPFSGTERLWRSACLPWFMCFHCQPFTFDDALRTYVAACGTYDVFRQPCSSECIGSASKAQMRSTAQPLHTYLRHCLFILAALPLQTYLQHNGWDKKQQGTNVEEAESALCCSLWSIQCASSA